MKRMTHVITPLMVVAAALVALQPTVATTTPKSNVSAVLQPVPNPFDVPYQPAETQRDHSKHRVLAIDGRTNPEAIPDDVAMYHFFRMLADNSNRRKQESYARFVATVGAQLASRKAVANAQAIEETGAQLLDFADRHAARLAVAERDTKDLDRSVLHARRAEVTAELSDALLSELPAAVIAHVLSFVRGHVKVRILENPYL